MCVSGFCDFIIGIATEEEALKQIGGSAILRVNDMADKLLSLLLEIIHEQK